MMLVQLGGAMTGTAMRFQWTIGIALALYLVTSPSGLHARDSRNLFTAPNGWEEVSHKRTDQREVTQYLPYGEDPDQWSQRITLIKLNTSSESALYKLINETVRHSLVICNEPPMRRGRFLDNLTLESGYIAETACDKVEPDQTANLMKNELQRVFIKQHRGGIFLVRYSWHHQELSAKARFDDPALVNKFNSLISDLE